MKRTLIIRPNPSLRPQSLMEYLFNDSGYLYRFRLGEPSMISIGYGKDALGTRSSPYKQKDSRLPGLGTPGGLQRLPPYRVGRALCRHLAPEEGRCV